MSVFILYYYVRGRSPQSPIYSTSACPSFTRTEGVDDGSTALYELLVLTTAQKCKPYGQARATGPRRFPPIKRVGVPPGFRMSC